MGKGQAVSVGVIPAGKGNVFVRLKASADVDLRLRTARDGRLLVGYDTRRGWVGGCASCAGTTAFTYGGMAIASCVDMCSADATLTVRPALRNAGQNSIFALRA